MSRPAPTPAMTRMRVTLDLFEAGVAMKRCQLRRQDPTLTEDDIEKRLADWLGSRPGAEHGDAEGRPIPASDWPHS